MENRVIKFRGKRIDNGEWVYGFVYRHDPPLQCFAKDRKEQPAYAIIKTGFADWNMPRPIEQDEVDGKTIGQFTGILDKAEKEIYEGDVLRGIDTECVVFYNESTASFDIQWEGGDADTLYSYVEFDEDNKPEIIGNIYDNPELLNP